MIFPTRRVIKDGSEYFGPYTRMKTVKTLLGLIKGLYQLRTCNYDLAETKIEAGKYKVCWSGSETKAYIDSAVQICHGEARTANAGREKYEDMYAQNGHDTQRRMVNDVWR